MSRVTPNYTNVLNDLENKQRKNRGCWIRNILFKRKLEVTH